METHHFQYKEDLDMDAILSADLSPRNHSKHKHQVPLFI